MRYTFVVTPTKGETENIEAMSFKKNVKKHSEQVSKTECLCFL